jgi:hypothetical protein
MKKRQKKKNWVKAGKPFLIYAMPDGADLRFAISHSKYASMKHKDAVGEIWSYAPEFTRQDTSWEIWPNGQVLIK